MGFIDRLQIADLIKAKQIDNPALQKWIIKLEDIVRTCPKAIIPSGILETFDKLQEETLSQGLKKTSM